MTANGTMEAKVGHKVSKGGWVCVCGRFLGAEECVKRKVITWECEMGTCEGIVVP